MTDSSALHRQSPWWMPGLLLHLIEITWNLSRHPQSWPVPVKCLGFFFLPTFLLLELLNAPFCTSTLALYLYVIPVPLYYILSMPPLTASFFRLLNTSHKQAHISQALLVQNLSEFFFLLCLVHLRYYMKSYLNYGAFSQGLGIEQNIP